MADPGLSLLLGEVVESRHQRHFHEPGPEDEDDQDNDLADEQEDHQDDDLDDGSGVNKVTLNKKKYSASQSQTELREVKV